MPQRRPVAVVLGWLLVASCVPQPVAPERANERWSRWQSDHFDLSTDLPPEEARKAAESLELTRTALLSAAWGRAADGRITARTSVVVFREQLDFEHYATYRLGGLFSTTLRPTIFIWGAPDRWEKRTVVNDESTTSVLRHELVHRLAAGIYGRQPRWFAEGLAQFLETMSVSEDGKTATLGRVNLVALHAYQTARAARVADALAWSSISATDEATTHSLYGVSWLLVHFLYNTQGEAFASFQTKLAQGKEPDVAWAESFPGVTPEQLDERINHYARFGKFAEVEAPLVKSPSAIATRTITAADVLAIRAQLAFTVSGFRPEMKAEAKQEAERALTLEPGNTVALRLSWLENPAAKKDAVAHLKAQVAKRPDDGDAWMLLGATLEHGATAEREAALRKAITLLPRSAEAYNDLAWELVTTERGEAALPFASKAVLLAPWSAPVVDTYAATLFAVGRCPDALVAQRRALDLVAETAGQGEALPYAEHLGRYTKVCGAEAR